MKRREFIATTLGGAAAWPLVARAQGERARRIVIVSGLAENDPREQGQLAVFRDGLRKLGWLNGQNIQIETLWRAASIERATAFVAGLVQNPPDIVVAGTLQAFLAMRREAGAIPMVFINLPDPVVMGFGNVCINTYELAGKNNGRPSGRPFFRARCCTVIAFVSQLADRGPPPVAFTTWVRTAEGRNVSRRPAGLTLPWNQFAVIGFNI